MDHHQHLLGHAAVPFSRPTTPAAGIPLQIGFVGLGGLGYLMARNLAKHRTPTSSGSHTLSILVWNRTVSKAQALQKELGGDRVRIAQTLEQIATECDVIFTNLANDDVVKSIFQQFATALSVRAVQLSLLLKHAQW